MTHLIFLLRRTFDKHPNEYAASGRAWWWS